jgi:hypothetical protein
MCSLGCSKDYPNPGGTEDATPFLIHLRRNGGETLPR